MQLIQHGGITMMILFACSVLLVTVILERFFYFYKCSVRENWFQEAVQPLLKEGKIKDASILCEATPGFLPAVIREGLKLNGSSREARLDSMKTALMEQNLLMDRFLPIIGTIAVIAPFIGLFGTVLGIIRAFHDIALKKSTGAEVVASGVAEALVATAAGLFVAILAVIFFNVMKSKVKRINTEATVAANRAADLLDEQDIARPATPRQVVEK